MQLGGRELETRWWGRRQGTSLPIVLLHEGLGSVSTWRDFPMALARETGRDVFAYSRWGHGQSAVPATPHTTEFMHDEARTLPMVLDAAGIRRAILYGHSDGGSIAIICAAEHPSRIDSLILEAPHVFVEDLSVASIEATTARYREGALRDRLARHHSQVDVAFHGWSDVWLDPAFRAWNLEGYLPRVRCPALLIQGDRDEYGTLQQIDAIERQLGGSVEKLVLAGCGHAVHRDQPEAVLSRVTSFVATRA
jgi:pimeloyl-ACP methyl ester carboxylesterase